MIDLCVWSSGQVGPQISHVRKSCVLLCWTFVYPFFIFFFPALYGKCYMLYGSFLAFDYLADLQCLWSNPPHPPYRQRSR